MRDRETDADLPWKHEGPTEAVQRVLELVAMRTARTIDKGNRVEWL
ncbi:hypothetical protein [Saccharothrix obliqua]|nr:hypothetical protein [Saccharothrix obliqua]MBW4717291.1 hypothetical protein [Saccharothrix obliqua]